jgi:hypothetical protein
MLYLLMYSAKYYFLCKQRIDQMKDLYITAHPDDAEVLLGYAIAASEDAYVLVAANGEASTVDMVGRGFCPSR